MTTSITLNGIDRGGAIKRESVELMTCAYLGEVGRGSVVIDDTAGSISIPAFKSAAVLDDDSTPQDVFHGFTYAKQISRGDSLRTSTSRKYRLELMDGNDLLRRKVIRKTGDETGKRPAETVADRGAWLLASPFLTGLVSDFGACDFPDDVGLDAADFRSQYAFDVLASMAKACRMNFYVRWNTDEADWELVFRDDNASTDDTCTLSISNALSDVDEDTVFPPFDDATLELDPEHVYSGALGAYSKGNVYDTRAATATAFTERDGITEDTGIRNAATAHRDNETFLFESRDEEQLLPVTLRVPSSKVGLVQAGMRINTRMTHMTPEGWGSGRYARILRLRASQEPDDYYTLRMDLSPQEEGPPAAAIVQSAFKRFSDAGGLLQLPNPVTIGNHLIFGIIDRNATDPGAPNTNVNQPRFGAGAWTRFNGSTLSRARGDVGGALSDGCAMWWKEADDDSSEGWVPASGAIVGIWEVAGADPASATVVYEDDEESASPYVMDTLGTFAAGDVAMAVWSIGGDPSGFPWGGPGGEPPPGIASPNPGVTPADASWNVRWTSYPYDHYSRDYYIPAHPWGVIMDAGTGDNAELIPSIAHSQGTHNFGGVAVRIPPA